MPEEKEDINKQSESNENQESCADDISSWIESIDELSEIEKSFGTDELCGKTILDIGTYGIKPLYIALKYKPKKIIGINDEFDDSFRLIDSLLISFMELNSSFTLLSTLIFAFFDSSTTLLLR